MKKRTKKKIKVKKLASALSNAELGKSYIIVNFENLVELKFENAVITSSEIYSPMMTFEEFKYNVELFKKYKITIDFTGNVERIIKL